MVSNTYDIPKQPAPRPAMLDGRFHRYYQEPVVCGEDGHMLSVKACFDR